jgi:outer membrane protein assembly factor BamA
MILYAPHLNAQQPDSSDVPKNDTFILLKRKGWIGKLARSITTDTVRDDNLVRLDYLYRHYRGRVIRNIEIRRVDFGVPINDTSQRFKNKLTRVADQLHHTTREYVIRKNLFFKENDRLVPILLADNERHLRDQAYVNDVKIIVKRVQGTRDSVDIIVLTKDVLSVGGKFKMSSLTKVETALREDNLGGTGDRFEVGAFFDEKRSRNFGFGSEYTLRNINGTFIDGTFGFKDFANAFNTFDKQEKTFYAQFLKPLVNPYMMWTYALEAAWHKNVNQYMSDSLFQTDNRYQYYNVDAWVGFNKSAAKLTRANDNDRLRSLIGLRFLHNSFHTIPVKYDTQYNYQYANLTGVLGSISIFRQDFYKTQYVYGFGRSEDVPEGIDFSLTGGWTNKNARIRPYTGIDLQINYFSKKRNYYNYTLRVGGYQYHKRYEDISILGNVEFFSRLKSLGKRWKQRTFITVGITTQIRKQLNEPLLLESQYGLPEYQNIHLGGDHRLTLKAETVMFNNWRLLSFRFAPFVFGNASLLTPEGEPVIKTKFYNSLGAGMRTRNESLVFGTLELRGFFFPNKNFDGSYWRVEFNTNVRFKYNSNFIRRPQFIVVN